MRLQIGRYCLPASFLALSAIAITGVAQEPYSQSRASGPQVLALAYRCEPAQRTALRERLLNGGVARFEGWKKQGILKDYRILFNSYLDSETFDLLEILTFDKYEDIAKWREIERKTPGGLSNDELKLVTSAVTYSLDTIRQGASKTPVERGRGVFFVIPYDYLIPAEDYVKYLDNYVVPQVDGWIAEKVLANYKIYLSRYATSRQWGSLFVLEYRDSDAFGQREATIDKVRARLKGNPLWLAASENKHKVRVEKQTVICEELVAR